MVRILAFQLEGGESRNFPKKIAMTSSLYQCIPEKQRELRDAGKIYFNVTSHPLKGNRVIISLTAALASALARRSTTGKPEEFKSCSAWDRNTGITLH